jgi:hypothetical protein
LSASLPPIDQGSRTADLRRVDLASRSGVLLLALMMSRA